MDSNLETAEVISTAIDYATKHEYGPALACLAHAASMQGINSIRQDWRVEDLEYKLKHLRFVVMALAAICLVLAVGWATV